MNQSDVLHSRGAWLALVSQRVVQRMSESKTNAADAAAALSSVDSTHSVRKLVYQRLLTNNCPISQ